MSFFLYNLLINPQLYTCTCTQNLSRNKENKKFICCGTSSIIYRLQSPELLEFFVGPKVKSIVKL